MVEVDDVRWGGVDGLPFWSLVSSSEATASDMPIFWVWAMRNQWLWAHLSPSMLRESRERSIKHHSSQKFLTQWFPDAALIGRMEEKGDGIVTRDGTGWWVRFAVWLRDGDGGEKGEAEWVMLFIKCTENQCVPNCEKWKKSVQKRPHTILWKARLNSKILTSALLV